MRREAWSPRPQKPKPAPGQPDWELVANLGDVHPLDHGGYFVYRDKTGVYPEEAELLVPEEDGEYTVYRVVLERWMILTDGYLVPFKYNPTYFPHPTERYDAWFHNDLGDVASSVGTTKRDLELAFTSVDPVRRADAYRAVGDYHGWENLDSYPLAHMSRAEAEKRYAERGRAR